MKELDTVFHGDCLDLLGRLPDESVDLIVSSPPYNLGKEYESRRALAEYLTEQTKVLTECARVLKSSGSIFWQVGAYSNKGTLIPLDIRFFPILEDLGLQPRNRIIWARTHGLHARNKFSARHETILWFTKSDQYKFRLDNIRVPQKYQNKKAWRGDNKGELTSHPDGKNPGDIWVFRNVRHNHEEETIHPCQFPEDLITRVVLATTDEGDVVLDPYLGAGTVAVVARDYDRHFLGAEMDPSYVAVAERRIAGVPDENGCFPNLKTLRDYCEATGEPTENYKFDVQVGRVASPRGKAKIFPEQHHLTETLQRLVFEEDSFTARVRGDAPPEEHFPQGKPKAPRQQAELFED